MAVTKVNPFLGKLAARAHTGLYKLSGGRLGGRIGKAEALILGTVGRKSGLHRETPLFYVEHEDGWAVMASNSGHDHAPDWYLNLMADPRATIRIKNDVTKVAAVVIEDPETREQVWKRLTEIYKDYDAYQEVTDREIPVLALTRVT